MMESNRNYMIMYIGTQVSWLCKDHAPIEHSESLYYKFCNNYVTGYFDRDDGE